MSKRLLWVWMWLSTTAIATAGSYQVTPFERGMTRLPDDAEVIWDGSERTVAGVEHELALPFTAELFGVSCSRVLIGSDGALRFPDAGDALEVSLFAGDLLVTNQGWTDRVRWAVEGQAPRRTLIVEFGSLSGRGAPRSYFSGQVHLREDGQVELRYDRGQRWDALAVRVGLTHGELGVGPSGSWREPPPSNYRFVPSPAPDLVAVDLRLERVGPGWEARVQVANLGATRAPATALGVHLSRGEAATAADPRVGAVTIPGLEPGARHTSTLSLELPEHLTAGGYQASLVLQTQGDADTSNDVVTDAAGLVVGDGPGLAVLGVELRQSAARPGDRVRVRVTLVDRGSAPAPSSRLALYLSRNAELSSGDRLLTAVPLPAGLAAEHVESFELELPADVAAGLHWVGAVVDVPASSGERRSALSPRPLRVRTLGSPDLSVEVWELETRLAAAGDDVRVRRAFVNEGDGDAADFDYAVFLVPEGSPQARRREVYRAPVPGLASGGRYGQRSIPVRVPAGLPAGRYALWLVLDPEDAVPEHDEGDNAQRAQGWLDVQSAGSPQLAAAAIEPRHRTALIGGELRLERTLQNRGDGPSGAFAYEVYLSPNPEVSPSDRRLARFRVEAGLAAGESDHQRELVLPLPSDLPAGEYWLGLVVDPDGEVLDRERDDAVVATRFVRLDRGGEILRVESWRAWVADGDTIEVDGQSYRFLGADTPEKAGRHFDGDQEPYASRASAFTRERLRGASEVALHLTGRDGIYGRDLAHVFVDGVSLSFLLVQREQAYESVSAFGTSGFYELSRAIRDEARRHQPPFQEPLRWRAQHRVD